MTNLEGTLVIVGTRGSYTLFLLLTPTHDHPPLYC